MDRVQTPILRKIIYSKTDNRHDYFRLELTIQGKSTTACKSLPGRMILTALGGFTLAFPIDSFISWRCVICLSVLMQLRWERGTDEHQNHIGYFQTFFKTVFWWSLRQFDQVVPLSHVYFNTMSLQLKKIYEKVLFIFI